MPSFFWEKNGTWDFAQPVEQQQLQQLPLTVVPTDVSASVIWHEEHLRPLQHEQPPVTSAEASDSISSACEEEGCNQIGCYGYQQKGHELVDRDEIITCSVYDVWEMFSSCGAQLWVIYMVHNFELYTNYNVYTILCYDTY